MSLVIWTLTINHTALITWQSGEVDDPGTLG